MVQNAAPINNQASSEKKGGFFSSTASTVSTALPGAIMGGAVGGVMSLIPPGKKAIQSQLLDVFVAESKNEIKSERVLNLLKRPELKDILDKFKKEDVIGALDDAMKKLPKTDELIVLAKKAAKSKNAVSLIKNGAMFGMICILLTSFIQSRKKEN